MSREEKRAKRRPALRDVAMLEAYFRHTGKYVTRGELLAVIRTWQQVERFNRWDQRLWRRALRLWYAVKALALRFRPARPEQIEAAGQLAAMPTPELGSDNGAGS